MPKTILDGIPKTCQTMACGTGLILQSEGARTSRQRPHKFFRHVTFGYGAMGLSKGQGYKKNSMEVKNEAVI